MTIRSVAACAAVLSLLSAGCALAAEGNPSNGLGVTEHGLAVAHSAALDEARAACVKQGGVFSNTTGKNICKLPAAHAPTTTTLPSSSHPASNTPGSH